MTGNHDKLQSGRPRRTPLFSGCESPAGKIAPANSSSGTIATVNNSSGTIATSNNSSGTIATANNSSGTIATANNVVAVPVPSYNKQKYIDVIKEALNSGDGNNVLISQSIFNGVFQRIFGKHSIYGNRRTMTMSGGCQNIHEIINKHFAQGFAILSWQADDNQFYMMMIEINWKQRTKVFRKVAEVDWNVAGYITSCMSYGSDYRVVLTTGDSTYSGTQTILTERHWNEVIQQMKVEYNAGKIITAICFNRGQQEYMVVMTSSSRGQKSRWFEKNDHKGRKSWLKENLQSKYYPTLVFQGPEFPNHVLLVISTDINRKGYILMTNYQIA